MLMLSVVSGYNVEEYPQKLDSSWINEVVSTATLQESHLLQSIGEVLDTIQETRSIARRCFAGVRYCRMIESRKYGTEDYHNARFLVSDFLNNEAWDAMNEVAPEGTSFTSHEGDGALFGFWQYEESF